MVHTILLDASRLLSRTERSAPTGIDRVCLAYAEWLIAHPVYRMVPVRSRKGQLALVDDDWFRKRIAELRHRWNGLARAEERPQDRDLIAALCSARPPSRSVLTPLPLETAPSKKRATRQFFRARRTGVPSALAYLNVGHTGLDEPELLQSVKDRGIPRIILVHDLIPVTHPEYCRDGDDAKHARRMEHALTLGSHIIANSAYTAREIDRFAKARSLACPPVDVAHLGLESHLKAVEPLKTPRPYFVHVGTIEGRKNLAFLLTVWRHLAEKHGADTPGLVLIGRYGWENEAVLDLLHRSPALRGHVHQAEGMADATLARIMLGAQAVLAPSSVEGFDLPAVEASAMGIPLIASDIAPHRELTPQARLIDPIDGPGWLRAIEQYTQAKPVAAQYTAPRWEQHFSIVEQRILSPLATSRQEM
ncbi:MULTISPECIES: glycosyltransferase family 4 protein [unclassified Brevundimonas]|uniref:glycosyltransferase family 4 protein n=1 Tax=unclassified Brevundimonas TaxID=2622653 RepID=UPI0025C2CAF5|nr:MULTISPECIES: glycosyltransferase family 1 protein [unclassified Brevundimonas]